MPTRHVWVLGPRRRSGFGTSLGFLMLLGFGCCHVALHRFVLSRAPCSAASSILDLAGPVAHLGQAHLVMGPSGSFVSTSPSCCSLLSLSCLVAVMPAAAVSSLHCSISCAADCDRCRCCYRAAAVHHLPSLDISVRCGPSVAAARCRDLQLARPC